MYRFTSDSCALPNGVFDLVGGINGRRRGYRGYTHRAAILITIPHGIEAVVTFYVKLVDLWRRHHKNNININIQSILSVIGHDVLAINKTI